MPVLETIQPGAHSNEHTHSTPTKEKLTGISVFLSLLLAGTLISLVERGIYDLNRLYNPHYEACNQRTFLISRGASCPVEEFALKQVLLHSYVSFPLFLVFFIFMLALRKRRLSTWQRALFRVSGVVSVFFGIQFLAELLIYLFQFHHIVGVYTAYLLGVITLVSFVIVLERRNARKRAQGTRH